MTTTALAVTKMRRAAAALRTAKLLDVRPGAVRVPCSDAGHEHVKRTAWDTLIFRGIWRLIPDKPQALANCPHCRSTFARDATPEDLKREKKAA